MQKGQTYITIVEFLDPNYVVKAVNQNKLLLPIVSFPSDPLCIAQRPLLFMFVSLNVEFYIPNRREFSIDLKNKVNNNI